MGWFSKNKLKKEVLNPNNMTPLQAVTHLCACVQLSDGDADFEEREAWLNGIFNIFVYNFCFLSQCIIVN